MLIDPARQAVASPASTRGLEKQDCDSIDMPSYAEGSDLLGDVINAVQTQAGG